MTYPDIVAYRPEYFDRIVELLADAQVVAPDSSEEIENGVGLVAFDPKWEGGDEEHRIIGFAWALFGHGSKVAYLDYFGVSADFRGTRAGVNLFLVMQEILRKYGVERLIASVSPINRATLRMLERRGAVDAGLHHHVFMSLGNGNGSEHTDDVTERTGAPTG